MPRRVYWDSCTFIGLLNQEVGKANDCRAVWEEAQEGKTVIVTSTFTYAEVFRAKCEGKSKPLQEADDERIENLLSSRWINRHVLDEVLGKAARRLLRAHSECKKPTDGVHLATALGSNVDEMHTYDGSDLLGLDGRVQKKNGLYLKICGTGTV